MCCLISILIKIAQSHQWPLKSFLYFILTSYTSDDSTEFIATSRISDFRYQEQGPFPVFRCDGERQQAGNNVSKKWRPCATLCIFFEL